MPGRRCAGKSSDVVYPVHVTDGDGAAGTPQHRYDAGRAGEIERTWQETWARLGTFHVPNPVGSLAPTDMVIDISAYITGATVSLG